MALVTLPGLNNLIEDISEEKKLPPNIVEAALREALLEKVANEQDLEIYGLNIKTNQNPIVIEIIIKKTNGDDISLDDCALFNTPASEEIENSNLLNCSYVLVMN